MRCGTFFDIPKHCRMNCIYLGLLSVFALCLTQSCSLRLSVWLLIYAVRTAPFRNLRCTKRPAGSGRQRSSWILARQCRVFPACPSNGFRPAFTPNDDSRPLAPPQSQRAQQEIDRARQEMKQKHTRNSSCPAHLRDKRSSRSNTEDFRLSLLQRRGDSGCVGSTKTR